MSGSRCVCIQLHRSVYTRIYIYISKAKAGRTLGVLETLLSLRLDTTGGREGERALPCDVLLSPSACLSFIPDIWTTNRLPRIPRHVAPILKASVNAPCYSPYGHWSNGRILLLSRIGERSTFQWRGTRETFSCTQPTPD